ncbi:MAG: hypothetical protein PVJ67_03060 [Candidatus Pacearchaeota archaeon]|jgi:hypothetical protein
MKVINLFFVIIIFLIYSCFVLGVSPSGAANVAQVKSETAPADAPSSIAAQAGNVTELNVFGYSTTQAWQGYFGNVTGTIQLADSSDNVFYNWSLAEPEGEIYASTGGTIDWSSIDCFNFSINGAALESSYNIAPDDVDGVNETFSLGNNHDLFYTNGIEFSEGQCMSTKVYDSTGQGVDNHFEEVLLWDGSNVVFTSLLEGGSVDGFDQADHDFEMLVLEDGHGTDTATTTYYFYVELQ